jgi:hypothetical protein
MEKPKGSLMKLKFKWAASLAIALVTLIGFVETTPANAAANYTMGKDFGFFMVFVFNDLNDAAGGCNSLTGKWQSVLTKPLTVTTTTGKLLAATPKNDFRYGSGGNIINPMVQAGVLKGFRQLSYDQCAVTISVNGVPSNQKAYKVTLAGISPYTFSHAQVAANFVNGQTAFEEYLQ